MPSDFPLLPSDRYIAELLGLTPDEYRYYMAEVRRRAAQGPQPSVVAIPAAVAGTISLVLTLISVGLTLIAQFFKPKQQESPRLVQQQLQGGVLNSARRYIPRQGFDAAQDIATIGDSIPLVYTKREIIDGRYYGGLRVNCPLIWSQIESLNKTQVLRAVFLLGEGKINAIDPYNTAIGNNTLGAYLMGDGNRARFSLYFRPDGGRLTAADHLIGSPPSIDPGNIDDTNVFGVIDADNQLSSDFCHTRKPNTQTVFGVYSLIGNAFGYRVNPTLRPTVSAQLVADGDQGRVACERDYVAAAQLEKYKTQFTSRSGLIYVDETYTNVTYRLSSTSDAETNFQEGSNNHPWVGRAAVDVNPFVDYEPEIVSTDDLISLISFAPILVNGTSISSTATFNTQQASGLFRYTPDGYYKIEYRLYLEYEKSKQLGFDMNVGVRITSSIRGKHFEFENTTLNIQSEYSDSEAYNERCGDVASAVAGRQHSWDDTLLVGELFKVGEALAICTARTAHLDADSIAEEFDNYFGGLYKVGANRRHILSDAGGFYTVDSQAFYADGSTVDLSKYDAVFSSDADFQPTGGGTTVDVNLEIVRPGRFWMVPEDEITKSGKDAPVVYNATQYSHVYKVAIASVATLRECRIVEIGIRSALGIRIAGICNFKDTLSQGEIDSRACYSQEGDKVDPGDTLVVNVFSSGTLTASEERYSFFRIRYREAGLDNAPFTEFPQCFGVRGITQQNIFNSIRFVMPSAKRWEFQFEPLSGWEIRTGIAAGDLELIDSSLRTLRTIDHQGIQVSFSGSANDNEPFIREVLRFDVGAEVFRLNSVSRPTEIGIGYTDVDSYADAWGKLAESFVYDEIQSSAESSPEHEIVYINEIIDNSVEPQYDDLAILGLNMRFGTEWQQLGQLSLYVTAGLQNTHLFPEVLADVITHLRYGLGDILSPYQIDADSFAASSGWCYSNRFFYDGAVVGRINIRQWAADIAAGHLLFFGESSGRFWLTPAWPGTLSDPSPVEISGIFTAGNILENSFSLEFMAPEDRRPIRVSVKYREERLSTDFSNPGLFPVERDVLVREINPLCEDNAPVETFDLSDYCTTREHAINAGKFIARMRRIPDHAVRFGTTHEGLIAAIAPGSYIRVVMDITHYDELRNGAVLGDGRLVTTQPFADGTYQVLAWNGTTDTEPTVVTLVVTENGTVASPAGVIFTLINSETQARTYQIDRISPTEDGTFTVEAMHMPTDEHNILLLAQGFTDPSNWIIED